MLRELRRRPSPQAIVTVFVVAAAAGFVLWHMRPSLILADNTPAGGDMGAHVWGPAYLRDHLLPHGRLTGWTPDWYAGFPALTFYFPLPSLAIVALGVALPYGVAFKLVTVSGLVGLPVAAWAFGRLARMPFPVPPLLAVATVPFLFDRYHTIWGGNIASALAGEFAFAISLCLALVYLGVLARGLETGRHRALAAVLLAATGLCHMIPTMFALGGTAVLLAMRLDRRRLGYVVVLGAVSGALAAFWLVPFVLRNPYTTNMGWERTNAYLENLFPFFRKPTDVSRALTAHMKVVTFLAAAGAISGFVLRRRMTVALTGMAAVTALAFLVLPAGALWNARMLPFWYLCLYLLAAVAVAEVAVALAALVGGRADSGWSLSRGSAVGLAAPALVAALVLYVVSIPLVRLPRWLPGGGTTDVSFVPSWVAWNYSGYESKPAYGEYRAVVDTMGRLPCGRAMWEYEPNLDRYGTPMALMLLPYWTKGCIGSMEGLFFESSATTPYHFLNQSELSATPSRAMRDMPYRNLDVADGVRHLQLLGVRYYMAFSPQAVSQADVQPDLRLVAESPPWKVYEVAGSAQVAPLDHLPAVVKGVDLGRRDWLGVATTWYQDPASWSVPLAAGGPPDWPRVQVDRVATSDRTAGADLRVSRPERRPVTPAVVSGIVTKDDRISFDVDRVGTPVVVKASYFPNWQVSGARGPWRLTPNLMVVVPTSRHVSLHYGWTPVDGLGWALTLAGVVGLALVARRGRVNFGDRGRPAAGAPPPGAAATAGEPEADLAPV